MTLSPSPVRAPNTIATRSARRRRATKEGSVRMPGRALRVVDDADEWLVLRHIGEQGQRGEPDQERVGGRAFAQSEDRLERGALRDGQPLKVIEHRHAELMQAAVGELHLGLNARRLGDAGARRLRALAQVAEERVLPTPASPRRTSDQAGASKHIGQEPVERLTLNLTTQEFMTGLPPHVRELFRRNPIPDARGRMAIRSQAPRGTDQSVPLVRPRGPSRTLADMSGEPQLAGQTILVIGGSSGIGLETARRARADGAAVILTARDPERVHRVGLELEASIAAFDATDFDRLRKFFDQLPTPIDHVLLTGPAPRRDAGRIRRRSGTSRSRYPSRAAAAGRARGRRQGPSRRNAALHRVPRQWPLAVGQAFSTALTAALSAMTKHLARELAPIRVNLIAAGFVDTPLSEAVLGDQLEARLVQLRTNLPIGRVIAAADIAALAVHLMTNTAVTGATFDIDGGQQLAEA